MSKKNRKRYQSTYQKKGNPYPLVTLTGRSYLLHEAEADNEVIQPGDLLFYLHADSNGREQDEPAYDETGGAGYLKARVYDGKEWQFLVMDDLFAGREHHFTKTERPLDTYGLCAAHTESLQGTVLERTYRSHYAPVDQAVEEND